MIAIGDILKPEHVRLGMKTTNLEEAVRGVASLLKMDERVKDWERFYSSLQGVKASIPVATGRALCIPHARTDAVTKMLMSVGRLARGAKTPDAQERIQFIFVVGAPVAFSSDYLRIIGALARIFKIEENQQTLMGAAAPQDFLRELVELEMAL